MRRQGRGFPAARGGWGRPLGGAGAEEKGGSGRSGLWRRCACCLGFVLPLSIDKIAASAAPCWPQDFGVSQSSAFQEGHSP